MKYRAILIDPAGNYVGSHDAPLKAQAQVKAVQDVRAGKAHDYHMYRIDH